MIVRDRSSPPPDGVARAVAVHAAEVHRFLSRLTGGDATLTEDLVQDVFVTALRRQPEDQTQAIELPWLLTVARSRFIDHVRSASSRLRRDALDALGGDLASLPADVRIVSEEQARWMLAQLPEVERWALALAVVDGMAVEDLASILGRSTDATHSLLARARRRLRLIMEGQPQ